MTQAILRWLMIPHVFNEYAYLPTDVLHNERGKFQKSNIVVQTKTSNQKRKIKNLANKKKEPNKKQKWN